MYVCMYVQYVCMMSTQCNVYERYDDDDAGDDDGGGGAGDDDDDDDDLYAH